MNYSEAMQWLNLLLIPMLMHTMHTDRRLTRVEAKLSMLLRERETVQ